MADRHSNETCAHDAEKRNHELRAIDGQDRHGVAARESALLQSARESVRGVIDFAMGISARIFPVEHVDQGGAIAASGGVVQRA